MFPLVLKALRTQNSLPEPNPPDSPQSAPCQCLVHQSAPCQCLVHRTVLSLPLVSAWSTSLPLVSAWSTGQSSVCPLSVPGPPVCPLSVPGPPDSRQPAPCWTRPRSVSSTVHLLQTLQQHTPQNRTNSRPSECSVAMQEKRSVLPNWSETRARKWQTKVPNRCSRDRIRIYGPPL